MPVNVPEIRRRRDLLKLTQQEAGERAGFKESAAKVQWHAVESGKYANPRLDTLEALAGALRCQVADLLVPLQSPGQIRKRPSGSAGSKG